MLVIVWLTWKIQFCFDNSLDLDIFFVVLVVACDELLQWRHLTCCEPCNQKLVGADGRQQYKVPSERKFRNVNMYQHETIHECLKFVCASYYKTTVTRILYHICQLQSFRKSFYVMEIHSPSTMSIAKMYLLILQFEQWHFRFSKIYSRVQNNIEKFVFST